MPPREEEGLENLIEAGLRKPFTISLNALLKAGYTWKERCDSKFWKLENGSIQSPQTRAIGSAIGGGGTQIYAFMPITAGKVEVAALYKRP